MGGVVVWWSADEDAIVREGWLADVPARDIAERLPNRTHHGVAKRARMLGLPPRSAAQVGKRRTSEYLFRTGANDARMVEMFLGGMTASEVGRELGMCRDEVLNRLRTLRKAGWDIPTVKGRQSSRGRTQTETWGCDHVFYLVKRGGVRVPVTPSELIRRAL